MDKIQFKGSAILNPVPVVLITSKNNQGETNVFTVGWTGTASTRPPMLYISIRPERLSYEYIKESMEFVVNLPSSDLVKAVDYCGVRSGKKNNKIEEMKFTLKDSDKISTPYIDECPINIECKVTNIVPLGSHDMFIAEVLCSHIDSNLLDENGKIHFENANLISYCHGEYFPLSKKPIGSFGYSIMKKNTKKRKKNIKQK